MSEKSVSLKLEGFWWSKKEPHYPKPIHSDVAFENKEMVIEKLKKVEKIASKKRYRDFASCRCYNGSVGTMSLQYKNWTWPEGFLHYIIEHNVQPSDLFLKEVLKM